MIPYVKCVKQPKPNSGFNYTEGKEYEVSCTVNSLGTTCIQVVDDTGLTEFLFEGGRYFQKYFTVHGDLDSVKEEI